MKNNKLILLSLASAIAMSACVSTSKVPTMPLMPMPKQGSSVFSPSLVTPELANRMSPGDQMRLVQLVSVGKPRQQTTWKSEQGGDIYEFTSLNVFVDDHGKPCRSYKVRALISNSETSTPTIIACRNEDANWVGVDIERQ